MACNVIGWEPAICVLLALLLFSCSFHFLDWVHGMLEFVFSFDQLVWTCPCSVAYRDEV